VSHAETMDDEGTVYYKMKRKGLGKMLDAAIESMEPLFAGPSHVGMGFKRGSRLITACDAQVLPLSVGVNKDGVVFDPGAAGMFEAHLPTRHPGPMVIRQPNHGERVFVLGRDEEGPYYDGRGARVVQIGVSAKSFMIDSITGKASLPLAGGLVLARADGAVIGVFSRVTSNPHLGEVGYCLGLRGLAAMEVETTEPLDVSLVRMFPMLHPGTWPAALLEEVVTHSSVQEYQSGASFNAGFKPLAYVGDSVLKLVMGEQLRRSGVPHAQWQKFIQAAQSNAALAAAADRTGLSSVIRLGGGLTTAGVDVKAGVVEALVGAAYMRETHETVKQLCSVFGVMVVDRESEVALTSRSRGSASSSSSSFPLVPVGPQTGSGGVG